ncbi:pre-mRNA-splicing factor CWC22 [Coprinopsis cinerea okayama7|uniref:Pre-mRNA-splicing factor CWC22 n=1 Tax=Coprinopsis cinerea (strain Okayama-7 / 130 / ATCC MYA-4618 / FGSC 9003) TaxID=240176 RepID=A8P9T1_COPC7|nr:pre-mRNA-splicing factor CWC22 [Coprinopsis cinerea okayama7\|eukprot:XP_001839832.2 pre-mRNA-splicing factor CWC22 [Coprinopsis cinerea okayama7\
MDVDSHSQQKRKRSPSPDSDGTPPRSTRRRSRSPPSSKDRGQNDDAGPSKELVKTTEKPAEKDFDAKAEFAKLLGNNTRSGGVYMPPARLRALQEAAAAKDKASPEYQRLSWDALRKSITGIVNRVNIANIKQIIPELFSENLIRGRGLFARSIMKAQAASLPFTPVFAAVVAVVNTKLPQVGELVLIRLISQFRRAFKRNDKIVCNSTTTFIAHLVNQTVAHEIIALQILVLLLERPTDDSIEIAVGFMREVGAFLAENSPKANATVYERFRAVLNEGNISHRVQYMIEVLMQVRKDKYKDNPTIPEGLDLVEEEEQITHQIQLEEELQIQDGLNIFKFDPNYLENEEKYKAIKAEILGEDSDDDDESGSDSDDSDDDSDDEVMPDKEGIEDKTGTNLVNLRRTIYLTIMNALNYEEAVHKLLKVQLQEGEEIELVNMIIECCSQERSYSTFYGLIGERFSRLNRVWTDCFEQAFVNYYNTIHRYETNRLRNIARFFGHMLASDAIAWTVFECVKMNEDDTTSSSRIFIKILMQEMMESMGLATLKERFQDPEIKHACAGMFPTDIPKNTRFSINYFTSIGLGVVTEDMREWLKNAPKLIMEQRRAMLEAESSSSDSSDSDSTSDSDSDSDSDTDSSESDSSSSSDSYYSRRRSRSYRRRSRSRSVSSSRSRGPSRRRGRDRSSSRDSTPPRRRRSPSRSVTPPRRDRDRSPPRRDKDRDGLRDYRRDDRDYRDRDGDRERDGDYRSRDYPNDKMDVEMDQADYQRDRRDRTPPRGSGGYRRGSPVGRDRDRERERDGGRDRDREREREKDRDRRPPPPSPSPPPRERDRPNDYDRGYRNGPSHSHDERDRSRSRSRSPPPHMRRRSATPPVASAGGGRERDRGYERRR